MNQKHTKGPWKLVKKITPGQFGTDYQIRNEDNHMICEVGPCEQDGNSSLIAAAPEMLDCLERLISMPSYELENVKSLAREVVSKARGES